jgi:tRNA-Thr(GGU) m(6)t(6)A37 methyltransferase TsaA
VLDTALTSALDGIEDWSHIYVIFWLHQIPTSEAPVLHHSSQQAEYPPVGIFAARSPIHPNPLGLTLVELVKRKENILWVRGLDALDGTPVLDIKPYPDWEQGRLLVVTDFRIPAWLSEIITNDP